MFKARCVLLLSFLSLALPAAFAAPAPPNQLTSALRWRSVGPYTGGRVTAVAGIAAADLSVDLRQLVLYERTLVGSLGYNFDIPRVLDLMAAGRIDASPLITGIRPLTAGVATLQELSSPDHEHIKVLLTPREA